MIGLNSHVAEFVSLENDLHDCLDLGETSHEEVQASHQARVSLWFNLRASSVRLRDVFLKMLFAFRPCCISSFLRHN